MTGQNGRRIAEPERVSINDGYGTSFRSMGPTSNQSMSTINGEHWKQYQHPKTKCVVIVIGWDPLFKQIQWDINLLSVMEDANDRHIQISPIYLGKLFVHSVTIDSSPLWLRWFSVYVSRKVGVWLWWKQILPSIVCKSFDGWRKHENHNKMKRSWTIRLRLCYVLGAHELDSLLKNKPKPGTVSTQFKM